MLKARAHQQIADSDEASQIKKDDSVTAVSVAGKKLQNLLAGGKAGTDDPGHEAPAVLSTFLKSTLFPMKLLLLSFVFLLLIWIFSRLSVVFAFYFNIVLEVGKLRVLF